MSRKKKRKRGSSQKAPRPPATPGGRRGWLWLGLGALVLLAVLGSARALLRPVDPPELPELDLASMEPKVAEKLSERVSAVREAPGSHEAWGNLAMALQAHGLEREAASCYEKAVELGPSEFRWRYLLVHALRSFDAERALAVAGDALAVDDTYSPAHVIRAELLEEQNEMEGALEHYERALELDPESAIATFGTGRLYFSRGDVERAREHLLRAVELDPEAGAIHASLAQVERRLGNRDEAMKEAQLAFEKKNAIAINDPIHFRMRQESVSSLAQLDRAMQATAAGDHARAERILRDLVDLRPEDADMQARLGDSLMQQGEHAEAKAHYRAALDVNPEQAAALYGLANALNSEGDYDEAESLYRKAREVRPDHVETLLNLGSLRAFRGDTEEAEALFRQGLEIDAEHPGGHRELGELLLKEDRSLDEAIEHFRAALEAEPDSGRVHANLAVALAREGRFEEARSHARTAERLRAPLPPQFMQGLESVLSSQAAGDPGPVEPEKPPPPPRASGDEALPEASPPIRAALDEAARHAAVGDLSRAEASLRRALELSPSNSNGEARYHLANLLASRSRWDEAVEHFRGALEAAPSSAEIHHRLALALRETGDVEEALQHLERAAELAPDSAAIESDLAGTLKRTGRAEEAIEHYRRALELDPGLSVAWNDLGSLQGSEGRIDDAIESFRRAVAADEDHAVAHNNLGLALRMSGAGDESIPHFERAAELRPDWPVPLREIAWILATHPEGNRRDPERAVRLAARAKELTSASDPVVLDTLAAAYASAGDFERAFETATRAAELAESRAPKLAEQIRARAELYGREEPFREPSR